MPQLAGEQHPQAKLTRAQVQSIRREYVPGVISLQVLGDKYSVSKSTISRIINGTLWPAKNGQLATITN